MNADELRTADKNLIPELAKKLSAADVAFLFESLNEKDDRLRYNAFLLLQEHSVLFPNVYAYWTELDRKLENTNSYQRSIGLMLIAQNVRWDKKGRFKATIDRYLACCLDEKFITARQAIQGVANILEATNQYDEKIKQELSSLQFGKYKENQQKLLRKDVAAILKILDMRSIHNPAKN